MRRLVRTCLFASLLALCAANPASALVGPSTPGTRDASHAVMVLARHGRDAGFCSAVVLSPRVVMTAAHCVAAPTDTRVHFRDSSGRPILLPVARIAIHPLYRADAVKRRERSIDLALVETRAALPASFRGVEIAARHATAPGSRFRIAGFGLSREGAPATGGLLRSGVLALRAPVSSVLLWAEDPRHRGFGACTGDSGAPVFAEGNDDLVAITDWATGPKGRGCGALTQATWVAPQRAWIEDVLRRWDL